MKGIEKLMAMAILALLIWMAIHFMNLADIRPGLPGETAPAAKADGQQAVERFDVTVVKLNCAKKIEAGRTARRTIIATSVRDDGKGWLTLTLMDGKELIINKNDVDFRKEDSLSFREMRRLERRSGGCFIDSALR